MQFLAELSFLVLTSTSVNVCNFNKILVKLKLNSFKRNTQ